MVKQTDGYRHLWRGTAAVGEDRRRISTDGRHLITCIESTEIQTYGASEFLCLDSGLSGADGSQRTKRVSACSGPAKNKIGLLDCGVASATLPYLLASRL